MNDRKPPILRAALSLAVVTLLAVTLLTGVLALTRGAIAENGKQAQRQALAVLLASDRYDNEVSNDRVYLIAPAWLGSEQPMQVFRARHHGQPSTLVLEAVAAQAGAGPIHVLIAIDRAGRVRGVRMTGAEETTGSGAAIEVPASAWTPGFKFDTPDEPNIEQWRAKRDGGPLGPSASAAVTSQAVANALRLAGQLVARHGDSLYSAPADAMVVYSDSPEATLPR